MTRTVDFEAFTAQAAQLLQEVEAGETIVITRDGQPTIYIQAAPSPELPGTQPLRTAWDAFKDAPRAMSEDEELFLPERGGRDRRTPFSFDDE